MKNILITGGTGPLGSEIANFLSKNHNVAITTRKKNVDIENIKVFNEIDLLNYDDLKKLKTLVEEHFNSVFNVINCVGYYENGQQPFLESNLDYDQLVFDSNFKTVYNTAKTLIPLMQQYKSGQFISFSCNSVNYNYPWMIPFSTAKAGLESLTKSLANEFSKDGLIFNAISLATINSEHERKRKPYGDHSNWLKLDLIGKFIDEFLTSNNEYVNGNVIKMFKHSDTFYNSGYFERIRK